MLDTNRDALLESLSGRCQDPSREKPASDPASQNRVDHEQDPDEWVILVGCLKRIRKWRVPPHWSDRDWFEEVGAEATVAALQAKRDYDPDRGVPWGIYLRRRVTNTALTRYRREWSFAIHRASTAASHDSGAAPRSSPLSDESIDRLLQEALKRLSRPDSWLITELFWAGRSEANLGQCLGISQQAVNKRKRLIFKTLHRIIDDLAEKMELGL